MSSNSIQTPVVNASNKVARSRDRMRAAGLRPVQFWVPDTRLTSFAADLREQCLAIKGDAQEADVMGFTEEAMGQIEGWK